MYELKIVNFCEFRMDPLFCVSIHNKRKKLQIKSLLRVLVNYKMLLDVIQFIFYENKRKINVFRVNFAGRNI